MAKEFFLGSNSANGFHSLFGELYSPQDGWRAYILKGGPGTGKSTLMREIAAVVVSNGFEAEKIFCASDPASLDAVIFPELRVCVADGTAPHVIEPQYPGAAEETVNLGAYWDSTLLRKYARRIINVTDYNRSLHRRAARFVGAAAVLEADTRTISRHCTDLEKAERYALRFVARELGDLSPRRGDEKLRFLSAFTPDGFVTKEKTLRSFGDRVIAVCDEAGGTSAALLSFLRREAVANGHSVVCCLNPLFPTEPEALIFPHAGISFVTANSRHSFEGVITQKIHARRFVNAEALAARRNRLVFNKKASEELLVEAAKLLRKAKIVHDEIERFYVDAMDFSRVSAEVARISDEILG